MEDKKRRRASAAAVRQPAVRRVILRMLVRLPMRLCNPPSIPLQANLSLGPIRGLTQREWRRSAAPASSY